MKTFSRFLRLLYCPLRRQCAVRIMGGLGNQMFQYAFGRLLEDHIGADVTYDMSWFEDIRCAADEKKKAGDKNVNGATIRDYELSMFDLQIKTIGRKALRKYQEIVEPSEFQYDESLLSPKKKRTLYTGYFQNEKYYRSIKGELIKSFRFPRIPATDSFNQEWLCKIRSCKNPVFVHVRKGDYIGKNILPLEYYRRSVAYIAEKVSGAEFFIFGTDGVASLKDCFSRKHPFHFVGTANNEAGEDWKDIVLMMACKHAIIANSSFSWWAAYLSDCREQIVTIPKDWLITKENGLICEKWAAISWE